MSWLEPELHRCICLPRLTDSYNWVLCKPLHVAIIFLPCFLQQFELLSVTLNLQSFKSVFLTKKSKWNLSSQTLSVKTKQNYFYNMFIFLRLLLRVLSWHANFLTLQAFPWTIPNVSHLYFKNESFWKCMHSLWCFHLCLLIWFLRAGFLPGLVLFSPLWLLAHVLSFSSVDNFLRKSS